ncbi:hypothetical protein DB30_03468 [Enhygromyxa salina]|uniref:Uncharacterized protein n=1 Tax=Enhygromyxa salina TaxID=215803 RepID=A0A0C2D6M4_9BACT|nr:hypothetical protein [Enhygromyxa salina]KIG17285.1 hypothetical protein DB30_03468 [Enhygromyxa salina]
MALTAATGCVEDQEYVIVERAIWFDDTATECTLTGSEPTPLSMTVDVAFSSPIGMAFVVANQQLPNANSNTGIDDTEVVLETAEVSLTFTGGGISANSFEIPVHSNSIPGGGSDIYLIEVPSEVGASLRTTMAALPAGSVEYLEMEVVFKGRRSSQIGKSKLGSIETRPYVFPFSVCSDCLGQCLPATECGGMEDDPPLCATDTIWAGVCGFAQGARVVHPLCAGA